MKLIARKPIDTLPDGDKRPGDTFEAPKDVGAALVESGHAEALEGGEDHDGGEASKPRRKKPAAA